jgi:hypothetical protein
MRSQDTPPCLESQTKREYFRKGFLLFSALIIGLLIFGSGVWGFSVTLVSPQNTTFNSTSIVLNATTGGSANATYSLNGAANVSLFNESTQGNTTVVAIEGLNNITVYVTNSSNATDINSSIRYFTVDTTPPDITIVSPTNATTTDNTPLLNTTFGEVVNTTWYNIDSALNQSFTSNVQNLTLNLSSLGEGQHNVTVYANDSAGNLNSSIVYFTVDTTPPNVNIVTPANTTITDDTPLLNATFGEVVNNTWYSVDGGPNSNISTGTTNLTVNLTTLSDGLHNVTVYANDSVGNLNSSIRYFTIDTNAPTITVLSPPNTTTTDTTPLLNATFGEVIDTAWYNLDGGINLSFSASTQNLTLTLAALSLGQHNVSVYANDSFGNLNSSTVFFTVISPAPPPSVSHGSSYKGLSAGAEVLVVSNSIDSLMANEFLSKLEISRVSSTLTSASDFSIHMRAGNRLIIILGGPDAPEGIGELVRDILSQNEQDAIREGRQLMFIKKNVYTNLFSHSQKVIIIAGPDRNGTKRAGLENSDGVEQTVLD